MSLAATTYGRALRAIVVMLLALTLSVSAHSLGGGSPGGPAPLVVLAALLLPLSWYAVRRQLTAPRLVAVLAVGQTLVHLGLSAMAPAPASAGGVLPAGHHGPAAVLPSDPTAVPSALSHLSLSMLLWHFVATVAAALILARGEAALWWVLEHLLPVVPRAVGRPRTGETRVTAYRSSFHTLLRPSDVGARGPPLLAN